MSQMALADSRVGVQEAHIAAMLRQNNLFLHFLSKKKRTEFVPKVTGELALEMWNFAIEVLNKQISVRKKGLLRSIIEARKSAIAYLPAEVAKALNQHLSRRFSHWGSDMSLHEIIEAMSLSAQSCSFYGHEDAGPSVTPEKMRIASVHITPERTAAVPKAPRVKQEKKYCIIHPDRRLPERGKNSDLPICHGCSISLGKAIKNGHLKKKSTSEEALSYLRSKK